jgi:CheY-like chemotaxis protein/HPt (histidine-containing phosphotransfer) domain-containing protein
MDPAGRPLCLLIVDDDQLNQTMMRLMLAPEGYSLEFASSGSEALEAIETRRIDLVFLDLILPDINGRDVAKQVREWEAGKKHLPIIAVTAYDLPGQPLELVKAGIDDYVFKPFNLRGLTRMVKLYAGEEQGHDDTAGRGRQVPMAEPPVLDYQGSLLDFSNDVAGYQELLKDFTVSLPGRLEKMRAANAKGDFETLSRESHSLKGVSAGLGAIQLSNLANQLGRSCASKEAETAAQRLQQMERSVKVFQAEVRLVLEA